MKKARIDLIDILRGFALLLIVLIHFAEHFEFHSPAKFHFLFSEAQDKNTFFWALQFIRGNAYSIFALLFGLSFYIQMNNRAEKGIDYRKGFAWRMLVLLFIGFLFSLVYRGDILHMYAIFAFPIILIYHLSSKTLLIIALLLLIQFPLIYDIIQFAIDSTYKTGQSYPFWKEGNKLAYEGSLWETLNFNLYKGRHTSWVWTIYVGRYLQIWSLFIIGILLGRLEVFKNSQRYKKVFQKILFIALPLTILFAIVVENYIPSLEISWQYKRSIKQLLNSWKNIFGTASYISIITLLYHAFPKSYIFQLFKAYGKLSLTNYIVQGTMGVFLFYGFGLGLWKYLGATWSLLFGGIFFFLQAYISILWNKHFYYGPIEWLWRCFTDLNFNVPLKRKRINQLAIS